MKIVRLKLWLAYERSALAEFGRCAIQRLWSAAALCRFYTSALSVPFIGKDDRQENISRRWAFVRSMREFLTCVEKRSRRGGTALQINLARVIVTSARQSRT